MKPGIVAVLIGVAAATAGVTAHADEHRDKARAHHRESSGLQAIAHAAQTGEPGHGWRYFADARHGRAVVISPGGDYFYSRGKGLDLVYPVSPAPQAG